MKEYDINLKKRCTSVAVALLLTYDKIKLRDIGKC